MSSIFVVMRTDDRGDSRRAVCDEREDAERWCFDGGDRYRVVEYAPVPEWIPTERLPSDGAEVEFIEKRTGKLMLDRFSLWEPGEGSFGAWLSHLVLCWRPARPVGALPEAKEKASP